MARHSRADGGDWMAMNSKVDAATIEAYRETDYHVHGDSPFTLRVGRHSEALARAQAMHGAGSAFLTACNPHSRTLDASANRDRHQALKDELMRRGLTFVEGIGEHPTNGWPGEPSVLVLGISLASAKQLGARFEQNAIVWSDVDARPEMILLR